ncbi:hypothetical protein E2C01_012894 [Portunus trituberculatus]|uniref:Uncharacterized protein n=1 Tax=Portunus trituberculatus TaxID=210409 RepID=A0A5B7DFW7_PORTR|nr:hypothetical protein [Portunus trituberculatus]
MQAGDISRTSLGIHLEYLGQVGVGGEYQQVTKHTCGPVHQVRVMKSNSEATILIKSLQVLISVNLNSF